MADGGSRATRAAVKYLLDTDHCIALAKKSIGLMDRLREHPPSRVRASSITMGQLHFSAAKSKHPDIAAANIRRILKTLVVVWFDEAAAQSYGTIRAVLELRGSPIGPLDTWIAAHAHSLGWTLVTHNVREFKRVPNLWTFACFQDVMQSCTGRPREL